MMISKVLACYLVMSAQGFVVNPSHKSSLEVRHDLAKYSHEAASQRLNLSLQMVKNNFDENLSTEQLEKTVKDNAAKWSKILNIPENELVSFEEAVRSGAILGSLMPAAKVFKCVTSTFKDFGPLAEMLGGITGSHTVLAIGIPGALLGAIYGACCYYAKIDIHKELENFLDDPFDVTSNGI